MSNAINSIHKCIFNKDMPAFVISVATTVNLHLDCRHCIRAGPLSCQLQLYALSRTNHSIHHGECVQGNISNCVRLMKQNLQKSLLLRELPGSFQRDTYGSATFFYWLLFFILRARIKISFFEVSHANGDWTENGAFCCLCLTFYDRNFLTSVRVLLPQYFSCTKYSCFTDHIYQISKFLISNFEN